MKKVAIHIKNAHGTFYVMTIKAKSLDSAKSLFIKVNPHYSIEDVSADCY
jgi:hypothetical protein